MGTLSQEMWPEGTLNQTLGFMGPSEECTIFTLLLALFWSLPNKIKYLTLQLVSATQQYVH